ncbi:MAG: c-type cytochrome [Deltaproteobacteria bacterium]|jgi:uncharacterized membrane protein|nr:c-type cytochrome [Deltaproteobacteria bacterium]
MASLFYDFLRNLGYHHPVHPALTHVPLGLVIASFVFMLLAFFLKGSAYGKTAKHCIVLALLSAVPTVVIGYFDWQIFYAGSYIFPIIMKLILATLLLVLLVILVFISSNNEGNLTRRLQIHFLALLLVAGIGYFGGELVYGKKISAPAAEINESVLAGMELFDAKCSFCHFADSNEAKVGPGFKGIFQMDKLPMSGMPVTSENIEKQLKTPFNKMPSFKSLTDDEIKSLTDYLKTL